jgi:hypothetical protein
MELLVDLLAEVANEIGSHKPIPKQSSKAGSGDKNPQSPWDHSLSCHRALTTCVSKRRPNSPQVLKNKPSEGKVKV